MSYAPATEARIRDAFAKSAKISHLAAAQLLGYDWSTLRAIGDAGQILYGLQKTRRIYTEGAIRDHLAGLEKCREAANSAGSGKMPAHRTGKSTSNSPVIDFAAAHAQRRAMKHKPKSING